jgi:hypothetical protein
MRASTYFESADARVNQRCQNVTYAAEQPAKISLAVAVTVLIAAVPVFTMLFYLLPIASDFPSMAAALAPLLVVCGFIIAEPASHMRCATKPDI